MKISYLIRELQELQDQHGDLSINVAMNGYQNGDKPFISKLDDEFDIYITTEEGGIKSAWLEGNSRLLNDAIDDGIC